MRRENLFAAAKRIAGVTSVLLAIANAGASELASAPTKACRVEGMPNELQCGVVIRPLNPLKPEGTKINVHFLVVPARRA